MSGTVLKLIAIVSMLIDHVGAIFYPEMQWMRIIGRIAMPVFAFCIAEGYSHTGSKRKYLVSLLIFGVISELPFDLAFDGKFGFGHQNIMFTFALCVFALMVYDKICGLKAEGKMDTLMKILAVLSVFAFASVSLLLRLDYSAFAVIAVFLFYIFREKKQIIRLIAGVGFLAVTRTVGIYAWTGISIIPLLFYNGKRGRGLKWLFYTFYPGHLLILYLIKSFI